MKLQLDTGLRHAPVTGPKWATPARLARAQLLPTLSIALQLCSRRVGATDSSDLVLVPPRLSFPANQNDSALNKAWQKLFRERCGGAEVI